MSIFRFATKKMTPISYVNVGKAHTKTVLAMSHISAYTSEEYNWPHYVFFTIVHIDRFCACKQNNKTAIKDNWTTHALWCIIVQPFLYNL